MANNNTLRKAGAALPLLMLSALAGAQNFTASGALSTADGIISGIKDITFHVAAGIIALAAVVLLAWQGIKYLKGDPQFTDSLLAFGGGLLTIAVFMEVIKAVF